MFDAHGSTTDIPAQNPTPSQNLCVTVAVPAPLSTSQVSEHSVLVS
jgi:hypothetical protein